MSNRYIETLIIGGGQVGLTTGYHLRRLGRPFVIVDAHARVGDAWRKRWDSLRLFTPARFNGLPGMRFPSSPREFISKDQMADFLAEYADHFGLPIRNSARVDRLWREGDKYHAKLGDETIVADNVIVAMSNYQKPFIPGFAKALSDDVVQMHSSAYKNPSQLQPGGVLLVGAGNSGADIAMELVRHHPVWLSGNDVGEVPFRIETPFALNVGIPAVRFLGHHVLSIHTPVGRKIRPKMLHMAGPRVRVKRDDLLGAGVTLAARVRSIERGQPVLEDGQTLSVANVIWCTGFRGGFEWIDLPIFENDKYPKHERGVVPGFEGLYFVGLHFQTAATSSTVTGMQRDVRYVVKHLQRRAKAALPAPTGAPARLPG